MTATFHVGDAIEVMNKLPESSVDLILTSPPFLALRSYLPADHPDKALEGGSQATPGAFIDWLVDVVEACDRVLARHGSMCIELGDTYAGSTQTGGDFIPGSGQFSNPARLAKATQANDARRVGRGWPLPKSLSLIPELFRLTLVYGTNPLTGRTTDRWRLRNVVRWVRPNPPVGALGDKFRPATSELMVFCKSAKRYFDLDAVREPFSDKTQQSAVVNTNGAQARAEQGGLRRVGPQINTHSGAPPLDWWNIPPGGFSGAHYAVWPPELLIKPIKAMSPERVCRQCGEPSRRIVGEAEYVNSKTGEPIAVHPGGRFMSRAESNRTAIQQTGGDAPKRLAVTGHDTTYTAHYSTVGWSDCGHGDFRNGLVLDPFVGSGTTLMVATGHGRDAIGIDLDSRNFDLALERVGPFILERAS